MSEPEQPRRPGRPSLFTDDRRQRIVDAVTAGNYMKVAASWAGVSERTLMGWLARGRDAQALIDAGTPEADLDPAEVEYLHFLQSVTRAENAAEVAAVTAWRGAFADDWRAARDYLVRRRPDRWAATTRIAMTTEEAERRIDDALGEAMSALTEGGELPTSDDLAQALADMADRDDAEGDGDA